MTGLTKLFRRELELCEVRPGQTVAVLSEGDQLRDFAEASLSAARSLGAAIVDVNVPAEHALDANERMANIGRNGLLQNPWAIDLCCKADMVVDHMLLLFSHEQIAMQKAGTRILLAVEPQDILERLFPSPELRRRVEAGEARLKAARTLRFVNDAGTDVTYRLGGNFILSEYGFTATPGRWDHWPSGFLSTVAVKGGVDGRVVLAPGDIIYPVKSAVAEPIEFAIRSGVVEEVSGGTQAAELRHFMASYGDPRANAVSHIGWGLNRDCRWDARLPGIGMEGRAYYGNVLFSLGPDTEFGGDNNTACHLDMPMRNCTLWLDDELIVEAGEVVPADMRVHAR